MRKCDEIEVTESCFNKAGAEERLFVLLARDPAAPVAIRAWVAERIRLGKNAAGDEQVREALECASLMETERTEIEASRRQQQMRWADDEVPGNSVLTISRFTARRNPLTREPLTWRQFAALFSEPRRTSCTVATCRGSACPHKEGDCWSPAVFSAGCRTMQGVEAISCLVLDVDHVTEAAVDALRGRLVAHQHVLHMTHADRRDDRCVRVVVRLSRPVAIGEWPRFWRAATALLGAGADQGCGDAARYYYLPSRPIDADYLVVEHAGVALDVDATLAAMPVLKDLASQPAAQEGGAP